MKRFLSLFIFLASVNYAFSQKIKFGIVAGLNESTASEIPDNFIKRIAVPGQTYPNSKLAGFHIGIFAEYFTGKISIQPGFFYTTKGGVPYSSSGSNSYNEHYTREDMLRLNYLEIPINILYHVPVGIGNIFIGGGPYMGLAISGKASYVINDTANNNQDNKGSENVNYGSGPDDLKTSDVGFSGKLGLTLNNGILFNFSYEHGLTNLSNDSRHRGENQVFGLSLGYSFR